MDRPKSCQPKILYRRHSESQLLADFYSSRPNSPDWSISSYDSNSDSDEGNIVQIRPETPKSNRNKPRVKSAFGRTVALPSNGPKNARQKKLSTTDFWYRLPDRKFESINRLIRPTVASMCRESYTPTRRFKPAQPKKTSTKTEQEQELDTTVNLIEPTEALHITKNFDYDGWYDGCEDDFGDDSQDEIAGPQKTGRETKQTSKTNKSRKKSREEVNNIVNRLYSGFDKKPQSKKNGKMTLSSKKPERIESLTRKKSKSKKDNITLSYMWTGKDASSQKIHTCPVVIKTSARATFDNCSNRFISMGQM